MALLLQDTRTSKKNCLEGTSIIVTMRYIKKKKKYFWIEKINLDFLATSVRHKFSRSINSLFLTARTEGCWLEFNNFYAEVVLELIFSTVH